MLAQLLINDAEFIFRPLMAALIPRYRTLKNPEAKGNKCSHDNVRPVVSQTAASVEKSKE